MKEKIPAPPSHASPEAAVPGKSDALNFIMVIEQQERLRGRFDSEGDDFLKLRMQVERDEISPKEAIDIAQAVADSRQDYN